MRDHAPLKIALVYAAVGFLWITVSDRIVEWIAASPQQLVRLQTYKGWAYIVITTALVYGLMRLYAANRAAAHRQTLRANKVIEASLRQKELLVRELRHRVHNNLQAIIALMNISDESQTTEEAKQRVFALSASHELALSYGDISRIDSRDFLDRFTQRFLGRYTDGRTIRFESTVPPGMGITFTINHAVPVGMYLAEICRHECGIGREVTLVLSADETSWWIETPVGPTGVSASLCEAWAAQVGGTVRRGDRTAALVVPRASQPTPSLG